jgi:cyclohexanone monooxygenase
MSARVDRGRPLRIAVIGAGASGLMALIRLRAAGFRDVVGFEKAPGLGGTWRQPLPRHRVRRPSLAYRYPFAPHRWTQLIHGARSCHRTRRRRATTSSASFNTTARSSDRLGRRRVAGRDDERRSGRFDVVLAATGVLHHPVLPSLPGLDDFAGPAFHTACWDATVPLAGKRSASSARARAACRSSAIVDEVAALMLFNGRRNGSRRS